MTLHFPPWKGFSEDVSDYVASGTIDELKSSSLHRVPDKVIMNVDVFGSGVEVVGCCKSECCLIVAIESGRCDDNIVEFANESL